MRRSRALKRGHFHFLSLLVAGMIGYLIGDWHALAVHTAGLTASQSVALRFPEAKPDSAILDSGIATLAGPGGSIALNDASSVLLSPAPMVSRSQRVGGRPNRSNPAGAGTRGDGGRRRAVAGSGDGACRARRARAIAAQGGSKTGRPSSRSRN